MVCSLLVIEVGEWHRRVNLLSETCILSGLSKGEVVELLGEPDGDSEYGLNIHSETEQGVRHSYTSESTYSYQIGFLEKSDRIEKDMRLLGEYAIMIGFDEDDIVCLIHVSS